MLIQEWIVFLLLEEILQLVEPITGKVLAQTFHRGAQLAELLEELILAGAWALGKVLGEFTVLLRGLAELAVVVGDPSRLGTVIFWRLRPDKVSSHAKDAEYEQQQREDDLPGMPARTRWHVG